MGSVEPVLSVMRIGTCVSFRGAYHSTIAAVLNFQSRPTASANSTRRLKLKSRR